MIQFLREAVHDPDVLAIKQTIYRAGSVSPLMDLLIEAARRGKEVMAVVELKARFEEEANINWAERLEAVGAQVVYGVVGLKTHAKLLLVTRREDGGLKRYAHLSTGNYNPNTARLYTDLGYFTDDADLTSDVDAVFQQLASLGRTRPLKTLLQAPFTLHKQMLAHVSTVADAAAAGRTARIVVKINALTDVALIEALVAAAQAGAADRPDRSRRLHAGAGDRGRHRPDPRPLDRRPLPRAFARRLLPLGRRRRRRGGLPVERRLDGPQHVRPGRGRLAGARPRLAPARSSTNASFPTCTTARTRGCSAATAATSGSPTAASRRRKRSCVCTRSRDGGTSRMDLILWRHAEAEDADVGADDLARALTPKGERQAERMAEWLNRRLAHSTRALVSPALRCQQTAKALGRKFRTVEAIGPGASAEALLVAAGWPDASEPVLVVGHQPTLGLAASLLLIGAETPADGEEGRRLVAAPSAARRRRRASSCRRCRRPIPLDARRAPLSRRPGAAPAPGRSSPTPRPRRAAGGRRADWRRPRRRRGRSSACRRRRPR